MKDISFVINLNTDNLTSNQVASSHVPVKYETLKEKIIGPVFSLLRQLHLQDALV